jgi:DNA-binding NtrC family response regulator
VTLHCGTIPETLVEVELFGHRAGAFTGAERDRPGLLAHAEGGTLFLDAIDEAGPALQAALLRVLESGRYRPLAADEEVSADLRVISATVDADPPRGEREGELRHDLYYRLAGARVRIPPLRERREDILPIVRRILARVAGEGGAPALDERAEAALLAHDWPGNAREIENLARQVVALGERSLTAERVHEIIGIAPAAPPAAGEMRHAVERAEREVILRALAEAGGNKSAACTLLGMSRRTFYRRMRKHGIPL